MNILTDSPLLYRSPLEEQKDNVAIGRSFAQDFIQGFNKGQDNRRADEKWAIDNQRKDQRWADGAPMREAQTTAMKANAQSAVAKSQMEGIQAANMATMQSKMADLAGLQGTFAQTGYQPQDKAKMYEFLKKNPEFYGSDFHKQLEGGFSNAEKVRADEEEWRTRVAAQITIAGIKEGDGSGSKDVIRASNLTTEQREAFRNELSGIDGDVTLTGNEPEKAKRRAEVYRKFGVTYPNPDAEQNVSPTPNKGDSGSGNGKVVVTRGKDGKLGIEGSQSPIVDTPVTEAGPTEKPGPDSELKSLKDAVLNQNSEDRGKTRKKLLEEVAKMKGVEPVDAWNRVGSSNVKKTIKMTPSERVAANPRYYDDWLNNLPADEQIKLYRRILIK